MAVLWLPDLERNEHDRSNPWTERTDPKGCLHTTEGRSWPVYAGWTIMPHGTIMPLPGKGIRGRQHLPLNQGSFSLRNEPGGVQTNRDYVFQWELIGTCEKNGPVHRAGGYYWPDADESVLADLYRKVIKPLSDAYGIPLRSATWQSYPASYGPRSGSNDVRMAGSTFDNYSGWLGHQHVPENVHGDPGRFPWDRMLEAVKPPAPPKPKPPTPPKETDMPVTQTDLDDLLKLKVTLSTQGQVNAYNALEPDPAKHKAIGDTFTVGTYVMWGAAGQNRALAEARANAAAVQAQLTALTAAVAGIAAASPAAITEAFAAGSQSLADQLAALDVHITVADAPPAP